MSSELLKVYDSLGRYYEQNKRAALPLPVLIGGQARNMFIHGVINPSDSDIDLGAGFNQADLGPFSEILKGIHPKISFNKEEEESQQGKFRKYGTCECRLPNNMAFQCLRDVEAYLFSFYGASWWVDLPHMKNSILFGNERQAHWISPLLRVLKRYDRDGDGTISIEELGESPCGVESLAREASAELSHLMTQLEASLSSQNLTYP
tara:strand:- start:1290 stop:1907 length:618 start_codon:yes stop_codon:yes gene_type:complete